MATGARLRLNWFSPLPPLATDIGHYSARILPALAARADVTLWTTQESWDSALEQHAPVRRWNPESPPWADLNGAHLNCYQIGNNAQFHGDILRLALKVRGLVVLHDSRLQHLMKSCLSVPDYRQAMGEIYGPEGFAAALALDDGGLSIAEASDLFPMTPFCLSRALGALTHDRRERERLALDSHLPIFDLPLPYEAGPPPPPPVRAGPVRLVQFGYLYSNRRIDKILDALAGLPDRADFRLDIYGEVWDRRLVEGWIAERGLDGIVTLHGFVAEAELDRAILNAELAINLRWPTMGEASGSQLRIWNAARASLVTNAGWYAALPPDAAFFVDPAFEAQDIARHLRALKADPAPYYKSGLRGRAILETRHGPDGYVTALLEYAAQALAADAGAARLVGESLGRRMADWPADTPWPSDIGDIAGRLAPRVSR